MSNREYLVGLARAFGGAIIFAFPMLMTMEMWWLGFYLDRPRFFLFLLLTVAMLIPLCGFVGFERSRNFSDMVVDAFVAFGIGAIASAVMLAIFGVLQTDMPASEIVGKIAIQTVPASIGAAVARGQMGGGGKESEKEPKTRGFLGELFLMLAGAIFLAFNVAPTEEMVLIAYKMTAWHALALILLSIVALHVFLYSLGFVGQEQRRGSAPGLLWVSSSLAGYGLALLVSWYVLWTFGRTDGVSIEQIAMMVVVLGFPSALGAAAARLIV